MMHRCGMHVDDSSLWSCVNDPHKRLGHPCYEYPKKTASEYGVMWKGVPEVCAGCAMGKGHQKAVKKHTENRAKQRCERLFVDMSTLPTVSLGGSKYWILIVDDAQQNGVVERGFVIITEQ